MTVTHSCLDSAELIEERTLYPIRGETVEVVDEFYRCTLCGEEIYNESQARNLEAAAARAYRELHGFLQPEEIRAMRKRWRVSQGLLETTLGLGRKTVARWEAGRVLQNRSMDNLLRAIDRFPPVLGYLAELQGQQLALDPNWHTGEGSVEGNSLRIPRFLMDDLQQIAEADGLSVEAIACAILARGTERRTTNRGLQQLQHAVEDLGHRMSEWGAAAMPSFDHGSKTRSQLARSSYAQAI